MELPYTPQENPFVRLEPLAERHRDGLRRACAEDRRVWGELYPFSMLDEHFDRQWDKYLDNIRTSSAHPYIVLHDDVCVGMSSYLNIDRGNASVEIGGTYYSPRHRGGGVNPAVKKLLFLRAFEAGARRVQLCVDAINARSRAAVLKLGAHQDGILRANRVTWTGRVRDTVVFSVLADEWPTVRQRLDDRLQAFVPDGNLPRKP